MKGLTTTTPHNHVIFQLHDSPTEKNSPLLVYQYQPPNILFKTSTITTPYTPNTPMKGWVATQTQYTRKSEKDARPTQVDRATWSLAARSRAP